MQPYFLPYIEHFRLIAACDQWIVFDTVPYRRKTWMSRNRIINRDKGWSYVSVPVAGGSSQGPVAKAELSSVDWRNTLRDKLKIYEKEANFYHETCELVEELLEPPHTTLADLNTWSLTRVCNHLKVDTPIERLSQIDLDLPEQAEAGDWALLISESLGATEYRNPSGGKDLFDPEAFDAADIQLSFHEHREVTYQTSTFEFVPNLSILDQLMWCGRETVSDLILA